MCVVSMIMDHYHNKWAPLVPLYPPTAPALPPMVPTVPTPWLVPTAPAPSPIVPQEIEEFRKLLERAREYDRRNGEPDCELDEKRQALKKMAEQLGVDISFV